MELISCLTRSRSLFKNGCDSAQITQSSVDSLSVTDRLQSKKQKKKNESRVNKSLSQYDSTAAAEWDYLTLPLEWR